MTEMFGDAWPPMSVPDLAPDDDDDDDLCHCKFYLSAFFMLLLLNIVIDLIAALCTVSPILLLTSTLQFV